MKKNIYIVGDSFCFWRSDENAHWPLILANMLDLNLKGNGYPGLCWWKTRENLINFKKTKNFENTEYFVIVHTDFTRILSNVDFIFHEFPQEEFEKIREIWIKYMYNEEIEFWMMCNWFREINDLLKEKKVIHISGFDRPIKNFDLLNGLKFKDSLIEHSLNELKNSLDKKIIEEGLRNLCNDFRHNHFSIENNFKLALTIHNNIKKFYNTNFLTNEYTNLEL